MPSTGASRPAEPPRVSALTCVGLNDACVERMRRRVERFSTGSWKVFHPAVIKEARAVLGHIEANDGRIDVRDERLRLRPCGSSYDDHPLWKELADEAHGWSRTLTY
ncbi:hypothetical protein [Streptomyces sp. NPDC006739]|uniref:hypothetical protein n=1 Tax=Streptomyces sp. NPDC006739 TaxID=3364763 RepID=UPI0036C97C41